MNKKITAFMISFTSAIVILFVLTITIKHFFGKPAEKVAEYSSSVVPDYTVDDLMERSEVIVRAVYTGEYEDIRVRSADTGSEDNFRNSYFECTEVYYGDMTKGQLTVRALGGIVGGHNDIYTENPVFEKGKEYILFLSEADSDFEYETEGEYYFIPGMNRGVFPLDGEQCHIGELENDVADIGDFDCEGANFTTSQIKSYIKENKTESAREQQLSLDKEYSEIIESTGRLKG